MATTYAVHYAANLARTGRTIAHSMWDRRAGSLNMYAGSMNPALCRSRAQMIEWTTDWDRVTCVKCLNSRTRNTTPTDAERQETLDRELAAMADRQAAAAAVPLQVGHVVRDERGNVGIVTMIYAKTPRAGVQFVGKPYSVQVPTAELERIEITGTRAAI